MAARAQFGGFTGTISPLGKQETPKKENPIIIKTKLTAQKFIAAPSSTSPNPIILTEETTEPETVAKKETDDTTQHVSSPASDEEVENLKQQELEEENYRDLHQPITKSKYDAVTSQYSGCLAKVYKVFRSIMYAIFGTSGYGLGTAKDDRVHVKMENKAIRKYETAIKTLVDYIQDNKSDTSNSEAFTLIMNNFHDTVLGRMMQIAVLNPSRDVSIYYDIALQDINKATRKYNQSNPQEEPIDKNWETIIREKLIERNSNKELISNAAASLITCFAQKVTPAFIKENGLTIIGDFANSYVSLFGTSQTEGSSTVKDPKKEAALTLRQEIYNLYRDKTIGTADFTDFTLSELDDTQEETFLRAIFQNDRGSSGKPANEWYIRT